MDYFVGMGEYCSIFIYKWPVMSGLTELFVSLSQIYN